MKVKCIRISKDLELIPIEYDDAVKQAKNPDAKIWIDIQDYELDELEKKLEELGITGLIKRLCLESNDCPGFYPLKTTALIVIPINSKLSDSKNLQNLALLYQNNFLLSFRNRNNIEKQSIINIKDSTSWLPDNTISGLISSILIGLSVTSLRKTNKLRDQIRVLEEKLDKNPNAFDNEEISDRRSELVSLETVVQGQEPILVALLSTDRIILNFESTKDYLTWALANIKSADRTLEWLERRMDVMRSFSDAHAQDKTNSRLGRLTVLSTIFMPITFLAGIWGMNFTNMPELNFKLGYLLALSIMLFIAGGMYFYFRRRGWFE